MRTMPSRSGSRPASYAPGGRGRVPATHIAVLRRSAAVRDDHAMRLPLRPAAAFGLAALAMLGGASPAAARSYRYIDLGLVTPVAVNARNVAAASENVLSPDKTRIVTRALRVTATGQTTVLGSLPNGEGLGAFPFDIADDGTVVGMSVTSPAPRTSFNPPTIWPDVSTTARAIPVQLEGTARAIAPTTDIIVGWRWHFTGSENVRIPWTSTRTGAAEDAGAERQQLVDVNDAGDRLLRSDSAPYDVLIRNGASVPLAPLSVSTTDGAGQHPLGEDGGIVGFEQVGTARHVALRRPDGTLVDTGLEYFTPSATQGGAIVGSRIEFPTYPTPHAMVWKAGTLTDLADVVPGHPVLEAPADIATNGTIVGSNQVPDDPLNRRRGWMLLYQVRITGQVVEPTLPPAAPSGTAARATTRPVKGARVMLRPASGAAVTVTTDAQGRFTADVPAGTVTITIQGRSGCITAACTRNTIDAQDDATVAIRLDPLAKPAVPTLPKGAIRVRRGALPLTLRCRLVSAPCRVTAVVRIRRKVLATASVTVKAGKSATRTLPLTRAGRVALAAGATVRATLTLTTRTPSGRAATVVAAIRVHR